MKRLILIFLMFFAFVTMDAQKEYVCIRNFVYLRTGPGLKYEPVKYSFGKKEGRPIYLRKGTKMTYIGPTKNGYALVNAQLESGFDQGWVSTQYITVRKNSEAINRNNNRKKHNLDGVRIKKR